MLLVYMELRNLPDAGQPNQPPAPTAPVVRQTLPVRVTTTTVKPQQRPRILLQLKVLKISPTEGLHKAPIACPGGISVERAPDPDPPALTSNAGPYVSWTSFRSVRYWLPRSLAEMPCAETSRCLMAGVGRTAMAAAAHGLHMGGEVSSGHCRCCWLESSESSGETHGIPRRGTWHCKTRDSPSGSRGGPVE